MRSLVKARELSLILAAIHDVRIWKVGSDVSCLATANRIPVRARNLTGITPAGNCNSAVVLLRAIHVVRKPVVGHNVVELCGWLIVLPCPIFPTVHCYSHAAIVRGNHSTRIPRINPQTVIVAMWYFHFVERVPTIG